MKFPRERRAVMLAVIILVQALCALIFAYDVISDLVGTGELRDPLLLVEAVAAPALLGGSVFLMFELMSISDRMSQLDEGIRAARGEMADLVGSYFRDWHFTPSEYDVAMMLLKGVPNETIARVRGTAQGTVRAQCTRIYSKAGVDGRAQFISLFMEELLCGLAEETAATPVPVAAATLPQEGIT